jgi:hypothetical protein
MSLHVRDPIPPAKSWRRKFATDLAVFPFAINMCVGILFNWTICLIFMVLGAFFFVSPDTLARSERRTEAGV